MKKLLVAINAKYIHSNLAVYSLSAYSKKCGYEIEMAEYTINQQKDVILKDIYMKKPDFIGFSCYIWNIEYVKQIACEIKQLLPGCRIWFGGPECSYDCERMLDECSYIEGIMIGEGEKTLVNLIDAMENDKDVSKLPSIATNNPRVINGCMDYINLDELPFPYEELPDMKNRIIYYESSRGCPYSCSYCLSSIDKRVRYRSIDLVKKELKVFVDACVPQVKFVDRTFNCSRERTIGIWTFILENDNGVTNFHFEISADILTDEEISLLKKMRPGLVQLEIGVQSTNSETIKAIRRNMDFERLSAVVNEINSCNNVHQHLDLIAGLPYEDYQSFKKSFNDVYALKPQQLQLGFLKVLKGSHMWECANENDIKYSPYPPYEVLSTPWLSYDSVCRLKGVEQMVEIYYNSGQFKLTLKYLSRFFDTPIDIYEYLYDYYEKNGYSSIMTSRITKYEIVYKAMKDKSEYIGETLVYDLYDRENMKTRPAFASDNKENTGLYRSFYLNEAEIRKLLPDYDNYTTKQIERMTHIERFSVDIEELFKGNVVEKENYYLFDYKNISAVDQSVRKINITDRLDKIVLE